MFANWQLFQIHEKTFANGDNPSQIYSFLVQSPISPLAMPIFPMKVATVEALQSSMHQCSSYSGHTHLQLLNCVILPKHSNTAAVEYSARAYDCSLKTSNLERLQTSCRLQCDHCTMFKPARPSPLSWNK